MSHRIQLRHLMMAGAAFALVASGCVKDNTSPGGGGNPPGLTASFVGYSNPEAKQTTCGNCHVLKQQSWAQTGHARAWEDLQASGHAGPSCEKCHTTSGLTNIAQDSSGFFSAPQDSQAIFQDVQCEACHGPGQAHVTTPDETQPIPYFVSYDSTLGVGCGQCHSGPPHNPFLEDWETGAHGEALSIPISRGGECLECHEGKTAMERFGGSDVFVEYSDAIGYPIGCTTCHNPHGSSNTHEVREPITARDTTNLCIQCHHRNAVPDTANTRGPHSPQGPTFLGYSGWQPAGFTWDTSQTTTHSNPAANPTLCATCHVATLDVNNGAGQLAWHYTGHGFFAIPCVDTTGIDGTNSCDVSQRSFAACTASGCHSSEDAARAYFTSLESEMDYFAGVLWTDVNGDGKVDAGDTGLLPQVPATEFTRDSVITVAEGALFNVQLIGVDGSHGVHNPPYLKALLIATIGAVQQQYALSAPPAVEARIAREAARLGVRFTTR
jgi:predicted CXXCH cytochrome family protein